MTCPECFSLRILFVTNREIDSILEEVDRGVEEIASILAETVRRNMEEECGKFIRALEAGNIQPIDF